MNTHNLLVRRMLALLALVGSLSVPSALVLTGLRPAHAVSKVPTQSAGPNWASLSARLDADEANIRSLKSTVQSQAATIQTLRQTSTALTAHAIPVATTNTTTYGPFTVTGSDVYLNGYNLHIQNGSGKTGSANGLGNLILGYNEVRTNIVHTGSHNLIVGQYQTYTSYGGIVGGYDNSITGPWASAIGGDANVASGTCSSVIGGFKNTASGNYASVLGNQSITASAQFGLEPVSTSLASLQTQVTNQNKITSLFTLSNGIGTNTELTLTGVNFHLVDGSGYTDDGFSENGAATLTGLGNLIVGYNELRNTSSSPDVRTGSHNIIAGYNNNFSSTGGILGGNYNSLSGLDEFAVGQDNKVSGDQASVSGGYANTASNTQSAVSGGFENMASAAYTSICGGYQNTASGLTSVVCGGYVNTAGGSNSVVGGGARNASSGDYSVVSGGEYNTASGSESTVSGGLSLTLSTQFGWKGGSQGSTSYSGKFSSP